MADIRVEERADALETAALPIPLELLTPLRRAVEALQDAWARHRVLVAEGRAAQ